MPVVPPLSSFGRLDRPFLVPAKTASAVARSRGQGRPWGRRGLRASLDRDEHGRTLSSGGTTSRTPRALCATASAFLLAGYIWLVSATPTRADERKSERVALTAAIQEASERFAIPEPWIEAVIAAESDGETGAISATGAMGLMQLMPGTWRDLRVDLGLGADPFDTRDNVIAGVAYLRRLYDRFGAHGFLAAYNAGPSRYQDFLDGARRLPPETLAYVAKVESKTANLRTVKPAIQAPKSHDWRTAALFAEPLESRLQGRVAPTMITVFGAAGSGDEP